MSSAGRRWRRISFSAVRCLAVVAVAVVACGHSTSGGSSSSSAASSSSGSSSGSSGSSGSSTSTFSATTSGSSSGGTTGTADGGCVGFAASCASDGDCCSTHGELSCVCGLCAHAGLSPSTCPGDGGCGTAVFLLGDLYAALVGQQSVAVASFPAGAPWTIVLADNADDACHYLTYSQGSGFASPADETGAVLVVTYGPNTPTGSLYVPDGGFPDGGVLNLQLGNWTYGSNGGGGGFGATPLAGSFFELDAVDPAAGIVQGAYQLNFPSGDYEEGEFLASACGICG